MKRRDALRKGFLAATVGLAGCGGNSSNATTATTRTDSQERTTSTTDTATEQQTQTQQGIPQGQFSAHAVGDNWQMTNHDAGGTGFNPASAGPQDTPSLLWESDPIGDVLPSTLFIQDDVVCAMDQGPSSMLTSEIHAVRLGDGTHLWRFNPENSGGGFARAIGVDKNAVYLYKTTKPVRILAISLQDGSVLWSRTLDQLEELERGNAWVTDPIIYNGNVIFPGVDSPVFSVNAENGDVKWETEVVPRGTGALAASRNAVIFSDYKYIRAINIESGNEIAKKEMRGGGTPVRPIWTGQDTIIIGGGYFDFDFERKFTLENVESAVKYLLSESGFYIEYGNRLEKFGYEGERVWRREWSNPYKLQSIDVNSVYTLDGRRLSALDRSDGEIRWQYELERKTDFPPQRVIPVNDQLIIGLKNRIVALG